MINYNMGSSNMNSNVWKTPGVRSLFKVYQIYLKYHIHPISTHSILNTHQNLTCECYIQDFS